MSAVRSVTVSVTCDCGEEDDVEFDVAELDSTILWPCEDCGQTIEVNIDVDVSTSRREPGDGE